MSRAKLIGFALQILILHAYQRRRVYSNLNIDLTGLPTALADAAKSAYLNNALDLCTRPK